MVDLLYILHIILYYHYYILDILALCAHTCACVHVSARARISEFVCVCVCPFEYDTVTSTYFVGVEIRRVGLRTIDAKP